ncbi:MAG: hypothetical protein CMJ18_27850 [Phycisphaeraceae bacterium]|nr:hypothetical protein [Phycisphaeraceae bacterium]
MARTWIDLCASDDVPARGGRFVEAASRRLAVFRLATGDFRVLDDVCPHAGGSLSAGYVADDCVICPWHGWPFDVHSGRCPDNSEVGVTTYPSRVVAGRVECRLDG